MTKTSLHAEQLQQRQAIDQQLGNLRADECENLLRFAGMCSPMDTHRHE